MANFNVANFEHFINGPLTSNYQKSTSNFIGFLKENSKIDLKIIKSL